VRTILDLTADEREKILREAPIRCYREIAEEVDVPVGTIKRVIRTHHNSRLKRYK
jgi:DNA-directed RNA polymerase specialized sigma24 family protein